MSNFTIRLHDKGRCHVHHELADADIITDLPPEYGGNGRSFSSTDLVSVALGTCILTSIDHICEAAGHDPALISMTVSKVLASQPKMIEAISVNIHYPATIDNALLDKFKHAVNSCPVRRSLNDKIRIDISFSDPSDHIGPS